MYRKKISKKDLERLQRLRLMDDDFMTICFDNYIEGYLRTRFRMPNWYNRKTASCNTIKKSLQRTRIGFLHIGRVTIRRFMHMPSLQPW